MFQLSSSPIRRNRLAWKHAQNEITLAAKQRADFIAKEIRLGAG